MYVHANKDVSSPSLQRSPHKHLHIAGVQWPCVSSWSKDLVKSVYRCASACWGDTVALLSPETWDILANVQDYKEILSRKGWQLGLGRTVGDTLNCLRPTGATRGAQDTQVSTKTGWRATTRDSEGPTL